MYLSIRIRIRLLLYKSGSTNPDLDPHHWYPRLNFDSEVKKKKNIDTNISARLKQYSKILLTCKIRVPEWEVKSYKQSWACVIFLLTRHQCFFNIFRITSHKSSFLKQVIKKLPIFAQSLLPPLLGVNLHPFSSPNGQLTSTSLAIS